MDKLLKLGKRTKKWREQHSSSLFKEAMSHYLLPFKKLKLVFASIEF